MDDMEREMERLREITTAESPPPAKPVPTVEERMDESELDERGLSARGRRGLWVLKGVFVLGLMLLGYQAFRPMTGGVGMDGSKLAPLIVFTVLWMGSWLGHASARYVLAVLLVFYSLGGAWQLLYAFSTAQQGQELIGIAMLLGTVTMSLMLFFNPSIGVYQKERGEFRWGNQGNGDQTGSTSMQPSSEQSTPSESDK